jgi:hypothetical protein
MLDCDFHSVLTVKWVPGRFCARRKRLCEPDARTRPTGQNEPLAHPGVTTQFLLHDIGGESLPLLHQI